MKPAVSEKPAAAVPKPATKKVTNLDNEQEFIDLELSNMRRTIAKRLTQSKVGFLKFNVIKVKFKLLFILCRPEFPMPTVQWIAKLMAC